MFVSLKAHSSSSHHLASAVCCFTFWTSQELLNQIGPNLNGPLPKLCHVTLFILNPRMTASDWLKKWKFIKVFFLRTTGWNGTKFVQTSPWVVPIQNYIHRYCQLFKMADCATLVLQHYLKCLEAVVVAIIWYLDL